jgi:hypothetical protein
MYKKQHYVPASYLKAWTDKSSPANHTPYVWVFNKENPIGKNKSPSKIFTETDMYTIQGKDGDRNLNIEFGLGQLEDKFSRIRISKFNFRREISAEEKIHLCAFTAAAQFRTPRSREHHQNQWGNVLKLMDDMKEKVSRLSEEEKIKLSKTFVAPSDGPKLEHHQVKKLVAEPLQTMMATVIKTTTPVLASMDMAILFTNGNVPFVTSDNPCVWYNPEAYKLPPLYRNTGLINEAIEVTLPISPDKVLLFNWKKLNGYIEVDETIVNTMNQRQIAFTHKEFISNKNEVLDSWLEKTEMPDDAWGKTTQQST